VAAKHGVVGVMRFYASAYASRRIRVNTVHPTGVNTPMVVNDAFDEWIGAHEAFAAALQNPIPVPCVESSDISNAVAFLCSEEARYITGTSLPVDAGFLLK
jgi:NAD(P)-dependent dehydrogenase (short-subunit alcohol dehydrogenase family)